jgi:hypothetical protein
MDTISGIIVYGIVAIFLIVGLGATLFEGIINILSTVLQYGLKIGVVALIVYFIYSLFSKNK